MSCQPSSPFESRLDHVTVSLSDLDEAAHFYRLQGLDEGYMRSDLRQMDGARGVVVGRLLGNVGTGDIALSTPCLENTLADPDGNTIGLIEGRRRQT